jgi:hypothetical protein
LIFINFRALLHREGAWGIFYIVSSEEPQRFIHKLGSVSEITMLEIIASIATVIEFEV